MEFAPKEAVHGRPDRGFVALAFGAGRRSAVLVASAKEFGQFHYPTPPLGTSDSGFRDEVEAEEALARGQLLAEMGADTDRPALTGPAGAEAEARLAEFARHAVFDGHVVTDQVRLRRTGERPTANRLALYVRHRLGEQHRETAAFLARHTPEPSP